jgi:hypothetical protein
MQKNPMDQRWWGVVMIIAVLVLWPIVRGSEGTTPSGDRGGIARGSEGTTPNRDRGGIASFGDFTVLSADWATSPYGGRAIAGLIRNDGRRSFKGVAIDFKLLGASGETVGSTSATEFNIGPGETWRFQAVLTERNASSFRIVNMSIIP